jgi:hypothetical protein
MKKVSAIDPATSRALKKFVYLPTLSEAKVLWNEIIIKSPSPIKKEGEVRET